MAANVGICGGSGAGKTTLAVHLIQRVGHHRVSPLAFDMYYRDQGHLSPEERRQVNYDHPDSLDGELFIQHLDQLRAGRPIDVPEYDFATHTRTGNVIPVEAREVVVIDGILLLAFPEVRALLDFSIFIDVPEEVRLERRLKRDVAERGRHEDDIRRQFNAFVAPMHDEHVQPHAHLADRIVTVDEPLPEVAVELAVTVTALVTTG